MLELYVWGPAFGLPSIDAECLGTIAYFTETLDETEYQLIQSSPSAVPTHHLPALHDPARNTWTSGFSAITAHIQSRNAQQQYRYSKKVQADSTAYKAFLTDQATPLISLSLYVSSANWAATTRPAYSKILPFPLPWTEPTAIRAAMSARAADLKLSSLDTDAEAEKAEAAAKADPSWVHVPESIKKSMAQRRKNAVREKLTPEERSRIRLEGVTAEVLDVLVGALASKEEDEKEVYGKEEDSDELPEETTTLEFRCLAFGYLALMLLPEVPRPWLREIMEAKYPGLCDFAREFAGGRYGILGTGHSTERKLPWAEVKNTKSEGLSTTARQGHTLSGVLTRYVQGLVRIIPLVGEEGSRWWTQRRAGAVRTPTTTESQALVAMRKANKDLVWMTTGGLSLAGITAGLFYLYQGLLPFGAPVQTWRAPVSIGLTGLGAAGAMFAGVDDHLI
ncbi:Tom37 C-terminal domain-containing protein [Rhypophila decipiens]|uniref:Tom37 C-terminal domain-containing protein n=1 Tax=Rhypophila decipiens TaxID=261697 RepID=A0AAN6XY47_9PEZI|nr:Tom37 C-terminal domain-containing protein [Rhypophila decipiens]